MATAVKLGPTDHGRPMTFKGFMAGDYQEGYHYELIDGKLYVSPFPTLPENLNEHWLTWKLHSYAAVHPEVINYVSNKASILVLGRPDETVIGPDLAAYHDFPLRRAFRTLSWQDVSPMLVGEVLAIDDPQKDLVRNLELYLQVPSIREYWLVDPRADPDRPTMTIYRRHGQRWRRPIHLSFGDTYTTKLLPGFELFINPCN